MKMFEFVDVFLLTTHNFNSESVTATNHVIFRLEYIMLLNLPIIEILFYFTYYSHLFSTIKLLKGYICQVQYLIKKAVSQVSIK